LVIQLGRIVKCLTLGNWCSDLQVSKREKNVNDMGKKDIEENIWTNKGEWAVEN